VTWTLTETVKADGRVEITLPELHAGEVLEIRIHRQDVAIEPRRFGVYRSDKFWMSEDFDAPLEDFAEYM